MSRAPDRKTNEAAVNALAGMGENLKHTAAITARICNLLAPSTISSLHHEKEAITN